MATLIDEKGLQHYADKMVKAENRKVGTKSLPTALTEIDAMIDSMKGKFEQAYGDALEESFENTENTFKVGTGIDEDRSETVEDGFISIDKLEGKTLVNRLKGENKTVQLPHRIELEDMIIKPNADYTFQSSNGNAVASFKQPKYKETSFTGSLCSLKEHNDTANNIEITSILGKTGVNIMKGFTNLLTSDSLNFASSYEHGVLRYGRKLEDFEGALFPVHVGSFDLTKRWRTNSKYTLIFNSYQEGEKMVVSTGEGSYCSPIIVVKKGINVVNITTPDSIFFGDTQRRIKLTFRLTGDTTNKKHFAYNNIAFVEGEFSEKDVVLTLDAGINGVGRKSKNLWNEALGYRKGAWDYYGTEVTDETHFTTSEKISVKPKTPYFASSNIFDYVTYWNQEGSFIKHDFTSKNGFVTPLDCHYITLTLRKTVDDDSVKWVQLEEGNRKTSYERFSDNKYFIDVATCGKNLHDGYVQPASSGQMIDYPFSKFENKKYSVTNNTDKPITLGLYKRATPNEYDRSISLPAKRSVTIDLNHSYLKTILGRTDDGWLEGNKNELLNIQIEEGDAATLYEPYKSSTAKLILDKPLLKIGDVTDRLFWDKVKNKYCVERNIEQVTVNGEEELEHAWSGDRDTEIEYLLTIRKQAPVNWSHNMTPSALLSSDFVEYGMGSYDSYGDIVIFFPKGLISGSVFDSSKIKAWLKKNNKTFYYQAKTPRIEELEDASFLKVNTYQPTYFTVDSGIAPSKTIIDVPVLEQVTGKSGALRTPATLDRVYLDIQGSGEMKNMMLFEGEGYSRSYFNGLKSTAETPLKISSINRNLVKEQDYSKDLSYNTITKTSETYLGQPVWKEVKKTNGTPPTVFATVDIRPNETFTASVWIKAERGNIGSSTGQASNTMLSIHSSLTGHVKTGEMSEKGDWRRLAITYTNKTEKTLRRMNVLFYGSSHAKDVTYFSCPQLERSAVATEYIKREELLKTIALQESLRSLPNGVKDTIEKIDGEWKIIRRCGEKIVDEKDAGSWGRDGSLQGYAVYFLQSLGRNRVYLADKLPTFDKGHDISGKPYVTASGAGFFEVAYPTTNPEDSTTNDSFKKWIKENPLRVVYQLDTPKIESMSPLTLEAWKNGNLLIEDPINVVSTHTVALNKPGQILKNIEELTILRDRVEKLEANYDQIALEQAHQLALTKQSIELDYEI